MSQIKIDMKHLDTDEKIDLALIQTLQNAEKSLGDALLIIGCTPHKTASRLSQKAVKAQHKIQILKAQLHSVLEDSLQFRVAIRRVLDKQLVKQMAASRRGEKAAA